MLLSSTLKNKCLLCTDGKSKHPCFRCSYFPEKLEEGAVSYREAVSEMLKEKQIQNDRIRHISYSGSMWNDGGHRRRMEALRDYVGWIHSGRDHRQLAAMYLLTATENLYEKTHQCFTKKGVDFTLAERKGMTEYTLFAAAQMLCGNQKVMKMEDMDDPEIVGDDVLRLIVNALLIACFGYDAVKISS